MRRDDFGGGVDITVICVTGMPGAGKGEAVRILNDERGVPVVRMGDVVWEWVERAGLPLEPSVVGPFANEEREKHGNEIWALRCVEKVREVQTSDVVIDGVRTPKEIGVFRREFGDNLVIVTVNSSREKRLERIISRGRSDDSVTKEDFERRDRRELSWGLGEVIGMSQYELENEGDLEELKRDVLRLYERIKG